MNVLVIAVCVSVPKEVWHFMTPQCKGLMPGTLWPLENPYGDVVATGDFFPQSESGSRAQHLIWLSHRKWSKCHPQEPEILVHSPAECSRIGYLRQPQIQMLPFHDSLKIITLGLIAKAVLGRMYLHVQPHLELPGTVLRAPPFPLLPIPKSFPTFCLNMPWWNYEKEIGLWMSQVGNSGCWWLRGSCLLLSNKWPLI